MSEMDQEAPCISIEDENAVEAICASDSIVLAYPIYFSNLPKIMRDFIRINGTIFAGKRIFIIATMGLFSGDGAGVAARLLRKQGAYITGGLHLKMPDCIGDEKALKKTLEQNRQLVKAAETKIKDAAHMLMSNTATQDGLGFLYHMAGLFGQRLWFFKKTKNYSNKLRISEDKCIGCGACAQLCPLKNIEIADKKAKAKGKCTMCYRCVSNCPKQAITLLGHTLHEQCKIEDYL